MKSVRSEHLFLAQTFPQTYQLTRKNQCMKVDRDYSRKLNKKCPKHCFNTNSQVVPSSGKKHAL